MAAPTIKQSKVEQVIDFEEDLGLEFDLSRSTSRAIGEAIIELITNRTLDGISMKFTSDGRGIPGELKRPYSDSYSNSKEFKEAGKNRNEVNLQLTGEMLASMKVKNATSKSVTIGITDSLNKKKTHGHTNGIDRTNVPPRPYFGISKKELRSLVQVKGPSTEEEIAEQIQSLAEKALS